MAKKIVLKEKFGDKLLENVMLSEQTTFKIGGPAKFFVTAESNDELIKFIKTAKDLELDYFILGGGSNLLVSDQGYNGLIIKVGSKKMEIKADNVIVDAGYNFCRLVNETARSGLGGLEKLVGIYGTVGGAIFGNSGAFGKSVGSAVSEVECLINGKIERLKAADCRFSYRDSVFKKNGAIILSAVLKLKPGAKEEMQKIVYDTTMIRCKNLPAEPSAGCIFKNVLLAGIDKEKVLKGLDLSRGEFEELTKFGKLPVGYVIDALGFKGKNIGGAQVSEKHCNFIINTGKATSSDVIMLVSIIKEKVRNKLGLQLEEEIQKLGF
ncbi:UDP-N-acetylmuramate dehydrogenase [Candidatus Parcubacteria bacterium]|nr:MAG: UDP-N-acetylmuramate dehydrogenase [Candidatus Parcubacteria bacterium]